nr:NosD domain-containing protein [Nocardioides luti]
MLRGLVLALVVASATACSGGSSGDRAAPSPVAGCDADARVVDDAVALADALREAAPGDSIALAPGVYAGGFRIAVSGTRRAPITLCGSRDAVLDGGPVDHGYTLHLEGVAHWRLQGFSVTGGQKGVMLDHSSRNVLSGLAVSDVGDEGVHLRAGSSDNLLEDSVVRGTGLREPAYGEGIYVGSAQSNWCELTDCRADRSDRNRLVGNTVARTTAEAIDVKEGTTGGVLRGNRLHSPVGDEVDSVVDLKGNAWVLSRNRIDADGLDAVQVHVVLPGWGEGNRVLGNIFSLVGGGYAVDAEGAAQGTGTVVACDQTILTPPSGKASNVPCS